MLVNTFLLVILRLMLVLDSLYLIFQPPVVALLEALANLMLAIHVFINYMFPALMA